MLWHCVPGVSPFILPTSPPAPPHLQPGRAFVEDILFILHVLQWCAPDWTALLQGHSSHYWAKPPAPVWTPSSFRLGFTSYTRPTRLSLPSPLPHLQPSLALLITLSFCLWGIFGSFPECWSVPSFKVFGLHIKIYLDPWEPKEIRERIVVNKNKNTEAGASVWAYLGTSCPSFNFMKQSIFPFSVYLTVVS